MSVYISIYISVCLSVPSPCKFSEVSHCPWGPMIRSRPLIGPMTNSLPLALNINLHLPSSSSKQIKRNIICTRFSFKYFRQPPLCFGKHVLTVVCVGVRRIDGAGSASLCTTGAATFCCRQTGIYLCTITHRDISLHYHTQGYISALWHTGIYLWTITHRDISLHYHTQGYISALSHIGRYP